MAKLIGEMTAEEFDACFDAGGDVGELFEKGSAKQQQAMTGFILSDSQADAVCSMTMAAASSVFAPMKLALSLPPVLMESTAFPDAGWKREEGNPGRGRTRELTFDA